MWYPSGVSTGTSALNIFINDTDRGIKHILSKLADNIKLSDAVKMPDR